ncbi:hypothetical protein BH20ACI1_BH20ACI1_21990 [soil metagenome]
MHCPRCGHQQNSDEIRFCTKCGLEIGDVKDLLAPELRQTKAQRKSELNKATRQGMIMIFSGFVVILILAILRDFFTVPKSLFAVAVLIFIIGGAIRMSLPSLFGGNNLAESKDDLPQHDLETNKSTGEQFSDKSLPEAEFHPPVDFGTKKFDTNELFAPSSVTEDTTKKLEKEFQRD